MAATIAHARGLLHYLPGNRLAAALPPKMCPHRDCQPRVSVAGAVTATPSYCEDIIMTAIQASTFLRRVLLLDSVSSGAMGVLLLTCSGMLAGLLNLPAELLNEAGLVLIPFALAVGFLGTRARLSRIAVWAVIGINAIWAIDSAVLLFTGWVQPNLLGYAFVIGQAAFVAVMAELQLIGMRRSPVAVPARS
jgi:hypothetical protein